MGTEITIKEIPVGDLNDLKNAIKVEATGTWLIQVGPLEIEEMVDTITDLGFELTSPGDKWNFFSLKSEYAEMVLQVSDNLLISCVTLTRKGKKKYPHFGMEPRRNSYHTKEQLTFLIYSTWHHWDALFEENMPKGAKEFIRSCYTV